MEENLIEYGNWILPQLKASTPLGMVYDGRGDIPGLRKSLCGHVKCTGRKGFWEASRGLRSLLDAGVDVSMMMLMRESIIELVHEAVYWNRPHMHF